MNRLWTLSAVLVLGACRDPRTKVIDQPPPPPPPVCGDGVIQDGEDCDGSEAGTATCQSLGFDTGRVVCSSSCTYDTALCVKRCGNGVLDLGESCDGKLGLSACTTWGANLCTDTCTIDTLHCVTPAFEAGPELDLAKGGPAVIGDFAPKGPGDLLVAVPSFARVELVPWTMTQGFDGVGSRKLSFLRSPVRAEIIDVNADANLDVIAVNDDGTIDVMINGGATYSLQTLDAGCLGATFLPTNGTATSTVTAVGCGAFFEVGALSRATATPLVSCVGRVGTGVWWADSTPALHDADGGVSALTTPFLAVAGADLDDDGDDDVAAVTSAGVEVFENTGGSFASRTVFTSTSPAELRVVDIDGDGAADLFWTSGDDFIVRRNRGSFVFTETRVAAGTGPRKSVALGDADGDRDLDVVVTISTGVDSTKTRLFRNRMR